MAGSSVPDSTRELADLVALSGFVRGFGVADLDAGSVRKAIGAARELASAIDALRVRLGRRADELRPAPPVAAPRGEPGLEAASGPVDGGCGLVPGGASAALSDPEVPTHVTERDLHRLALVGRFPLLGAAFEAGNVSGPHLDQLHRVITGLDEDTQRGLVSQDETVTREAVRQRPARFGRWLTALVDRIRADAAVERAVRQRLAAALRSWRRADGMGVLHLELDPESFETVIDAVDRHARTLVHASRNDLEPLTHGDHARALALVDLITGRLGALARPSITLMYDTTTGRAETQRGTPIDQRAFDRLSCDASIQAVVCGDDGVPLRVGRESRTATRAQWAVLTALYATCGWGDCERPVNWCQAHHIDFWEDGGPTDLENLLPLCGRHHHDVHEGGWRVVLAADRTLSIYGPDGTLFTTSRPNRRQPATVPGPGPTGEPRAGRPPPDPVPDDPGPGNPGSKQAEPRRLFDDLPEGRAA